MLCEMRSSIKIITHIVGRSEEVSESRQAGTSGRSPLLSANGCHVWRNQRLRHSRRLRHNRRLTLARVRMRNYMGNGRCSYGVILEFPWCWCDSAMNSAREHHERPYENEQALHRRERCNWLVENANNVRQLINENERSTVLYKRSHIFAK